MMGYVCSTCKSKLKPVEDNQCEHLVCPQCCSHTPYIDGIAYFTESELMGEHYASRTKRLHEKVTPELGPNGEASYSRYEHYCETKLVKGGMEVYAAFQPFNESSRVIYPFIEGLKARLKPGDIIVDLWCRTGWSAILLSSLFPEQQVYAMWEGDNSVLGYAGYAYWFKSSNRPKNLEILFVGPNQPLPFGKNSVALFHGHDILHRRPMPHYFEHLLSMLDESGTILLPHIHLSNSNPDPFFERGGTYRHGEDYQRHLDERLANTALEGFVLSEPSVFENGLPNGLHTDANTDAYNGFIAVLPKIVETKPMNEKWLSSCRGHWRCIPNPLLLVCPLRRSIQLNEDQLSGQTNYLLERHPTFLHRLKGILGKSLSDVEMAIVSEFDRAPESTVSDVAEILSSSFLASHIAQAFTELVAKELLTALPLPTVAVDLQSFHSNRHRLLGVPFATFWESLSSEKEGGHTTGFADLQFQFAGEQISSQELMELSSAWRAFFQLRQEIREITLPDSPLDDLLLPVLIAAWGEGIQLSYRNNAKASLVFTNSADSTTKEAISLDDTSPRSYWTIVEPFLGEQNADMGVKLEKHAVTDGVARELQRDHWDIILRRFLV